MIRDFPGGVSGKESTCYAGDIGNMGLIPGLGRSLGGGHGNPLQYSFLGSPPMDRGAWRATIHRVAKSQTQQATECSRAHTYTRTHIHPHTQ